jgi:hypothetical protein
MGDVVAGWSAQSFRRNFSGATFQASERRDVDIAHGATVVPVVARTRIDEPARSAPRSPRTKRVTMDIPPSRRSCSIRTRGQDTAGPHNGM